MKYDQAIERLHARAAAATGVPEGTLGVTLQRIAREDFARSMFGDLLSLYELDDMLGGLEVLTGNVGHALLTAGGHGGASAQVGALYTSIVQVLTLGLLLKTPPVVAVEDAA